MSTHEEYTTDEIYNLDIHETAVISTDDEGYINVIRVPGGWIYTEYFGEVGETMSCSVTSTFVPWIDRINA